MQNFINLILSNIYLYISIILFLVISVIILTIIASNKSKRNKIKEELNITLNEVVEEEKPVSEELENLINQMKVDMETKPEEVVAKFEEEQESNAIISYKELVDNVKNGKIQTIEDEETNTNFVELLTNETKLEPINVLGDKEKKSVTPEQLKEVISQISLNKDTEKPKFRTTEFVSPVFGTQKMDITSPTVNTNKNVSISIDKTIDLEEITAELKKSEAFLNALIEFRNNL